MERSICTSFTFDGQSGSIAEILLSEHNNNLPLQMDVVRGQMEKTLRIGEITSIGVTGCRRTTFEFEQSGITGQCWDRCVLIPYMEVY